MTTPGVLREPGTTRSGLGRSCRTATRPPITARTAATTQVEWMDGLTVGLARQQCRADHGSLPVMRIGPPRGKLRSAPLRSSSRRLLAEDQRVGVALALLLEELARAEGGGRLRPDRANGRLQRYFEAASDVTSRRMT